MTKTTYNDRIAATGKKLAEMHNVGEKVTRTIVWNMVFFNVFDGHNHMDVDGIYRYMPETIAATMRYAKSLI